jgi:hypothetical protein
MGVQGESPEAMQRAAPSESDIEKKSGFLRRRATWVATAAGAVVVTVVGSWLTNFGNALFDPGAAARRVIGGQPLVTVVADGEEPLTWVLPDQLTSPEDRTILDTGIGGREGLKALVERHRGAPLNQIDVRIVLRGNRDGVRVVDARPRIRRVTSIYTGTLMSFDTAGVTGTVEITSDLDRPRPTFVSPESPRESYFRKHNVDLKRGEQVTLIVSAIARRRAYEFDIGLEYVVDGRLQSMVIGPRTGGSVFRVSGRARDYRAYKERYSGTESLAPMPRSDACALFPRSVGC